MSTHQPVNNKIATFTVPLATRYPPRSLHLCPTCHPSVLSMRPHLYVFSLSFCVLHRSFPLRRRRCGRRSSWTPPTRVRTTSRTSWARSCRYCVELAQICVCISIAQRKYLSQYIHIREMCTTCRDSSVKFCILLANV
jgi:hypothetical protein